MGKLNISVARVEDRLTKLGKDRAWLEGELKIEKNMITNWKARGIPAAYAVDLADVLGVSTDWLFERGGAGEATAPAPPANLTMDLGFDPIFIADMVSVYCVAGKVWQDAIRDAVESAKENLSAAARDKLKNWR